MKEIEKYIADRSALFWSVGDLSRVSDTLLVETILNYGSSEDVRELIRLLGLNRIATIFYASTVGRTRDNYFPEVKNFFTYYFTRHAHVSS